MIPAPFTDPNEGLGASMHREFYRTRLIPLAIERALIRCTRSDAAVARATTAMLDEMSKDEIQSRHKTEKP